MRTRRNYSHSHVLRAWRRFLLARYRSINLDSHLPHGTHQRSGRRREVDGKVREKNENKMSGAVWCGSKNSWTRENSVKIKSAVVALRIRSGEARNSNKFCPHHRLKNYTFPASNAEFSSSLPLLPVFNLRFCSLQPFYTKHGFCYIVA